MFTKFLPRNKVAIIFKNSLTIEQKRYYSLVLIFTPLGLHSIIRAKLPIVWIFFRSEISESNLPKQIGIKSLPIQIICQNIANSHIVAHNKINRKFHENNGYFDNELRKKIFL